MAIAGVVEAVGETSAIDAWCARTRTRGGWRGCVRFEFEFDNEDISDLIVHDLHSPKHHGAVDHNINRCPSGRVRLPNQ